MGRRGWRTPLVGLRPTLVRVPPFPFFLVHMGWVGGAPAHLGAGSLPHLAHLTSRGRCPPSVDPRGPPPVVSVVPVRYR